MSGLANNTTALQEILAMVNDLPDASSSGGEDVTEETNAYTTKLSSLSTAVTNLETALDNSSSGITPTGTINITTNGTYDVTNYASATVNVTSSGGSTGGSGSGFPVNPTAGDTPILMPSTAFKGVSSESLTSAGLSITLSKNGTYRLKYGGAGNYSGGRVALYEGNSQISNSAKSLGEEASGAYSIDYTISDGNSHTITVYGVTNNDRHPISVFGPIACINWDNGAN